MAILILIYGIVLLFIFYVINNLVISHQKLPLPPGPKGLPIIGNIADLPPKGLPEWRHWLKHKDLYGPISSITFLGQTIILIHDKELAFELLEKRSTKYSWRPWMIFACEMAGFGEWMGIAKPDKNHRYQRKLAARQMGSNVAIARFHPAMELEVAHFLLHTLDRPDDLVSNLTRQSGSLMLKTLYGYTPISNTTDPLVHLVNKVVDQLSMSLIPGRWLVDFVPWLRYLPDWAPGTGFKRLARQWHKDQLDVQSVPLNFVEEQMALGSAKPSYVQGLLSNDPDPDERVNIMRSATSLYAGGADTTVAALSFFFLAMALFPDVQTKAREEIDRVVGGDGAERLPNFGDQEKLPYIEAVVKETLRWQPIAPLCVPHGSDEDGEFRGYRIPKGSIILPSLGWFAADPNVYRDPDEFRPERFLGPDPELNPRVFSFGFGPRICPGRRLVDASLFLTIVSSLAVFEIDKKIDGETGMVIEPVVDTLPGMIAHPVPFRLSIVPRSEKHARLIRRIGVEQPFGEGDVLSLKGLGGSYSTPISY